MPFTSTRFAAALLLPILLSACALPDANETYQVGNSPPALNSAEAQRELIRQSLERQILPPLDKPLQLLNVVVPKYPHSARNKGVEGTVRLQFNVLENGTVGKVITVESPNDDLSQAASEALTQWKFSPATRNDAGVTLTLIFTTRFELRVTPSR
jgi:TonB family protein